jgi:hypothetical protein
MVSIRASGLWRSNILTPANSAVSEEAGFNLADDESLSGMTGRTLENLDPLLSGFPDSVLPQVPAHFVSSAG